MTERLSAEFPEIAENIKRITENVERAKLKAGRKDEVRIMAVTKTVVPEKINFAILNGISLLGENRVQEFLEKRDYYRNMGEIHFIGGLQNNKVKAIIDKVSMIHSVDSVKLAEEIDKRAHSAGVITDALIEVNIGAEASKHGVKPDGELDELVGAIRELKNVRLRGLMVIPPFDKDSGSYFAKTQKLFENIKGIDTLSMGMSGDYETAILYGSNIVRLGTALFGNRQ